VLAVIDDGCWLEIVVCGRVRNTVEVLVEVDPGIFDCELVPVVDSDDDNDGGSVGGARIVVNVTAEVVVPGGSTLEGRIDAPVELKNVDMTGAGTPSVMRGVGDIIVNGSTAHAPTGVQEHCEVVPHNY
jgi:hypothetical protein